MKCPKCGYLGFETTDRCRNCQYDFSLSPAASEPELTLHGDRKSDLQHDFDLPPIARLTEPPGATGLDLDRLFGDPEPPKPGLDAIPEPLIAEPVRHDREGASSSEKMFAPAPFRAEGHETPEAAAMSLADDAVADDSALPFDEAPMMPPAARTPLAVRRSTELTRSRPRTTRPIRNDALALESAEPPAKSAAASRAVGETVALLTQMPTLSVRIGAGAIDLILLVAIDVIVLYLTLRVSGLQNTLDDLRALPPVPLIGFLATLGFGYVAAFTVAGGQTIGKMALSLRVIGDDGRSVDAAGGMLRALGCMLVPITLGASYLPVLFTSDHRAIHDRLAGTRVVQE